MFDLLAALGANPKGERLKRVKASPQWDGRRFSNRLPERLDLFHAFYRYFSTRAVKEARPGEVPVQAIEPSRFGTPPASGLRITWFGHSSLYFEIDGSRVLLDPVWGKRASPASFMGPARFFDAPLALADLTVPDAVLLTHDHFDHLDLPTIQAMKDWDTRFFTPLGLGAHLEAWGIAPARIQELDWWEEARVGKLTLACLPARHFSGRSFIRNRTLWCGWALIGPQHRVYNSGDTAYFEGFKAIGTKYGPFDASCIELGAYDTAWPDVHIGPEQAARAWADVRGGLMLPVHWGTFALAPHAWIEPVERLMVAAEIAKMPLCIPRPGQSVEPSSPPPLERWWPPVPWQKAEDSPVRSSGY
jgi:L-ascorbate metabolism protein UlaG (beta-lactamase superfamily)